MSRFRIAAIMPSMSGWSDGRREAASRCSYTNLVETLMPGLAIRTWHWGIGGRGVKISPIPSESAVPRITQ